MVVRKRPASEGESDCVECTEDQVQVRENKTKVDLTPYVQTHVFEFDDTFYEVCRTSQLLLLLAHSNEACMHEETYACLFYLLVFLFTCIF